MVGGVPIGELFVVQSRRSFSALFAGYGSVTREAYLRLHQAYEKINYKEDARDLCNEMRKTYPTDREVRDVCGAAPAAATSQ